jgi:hypothetical protein
MALPGSIRPFEGIGVRRLTGERVGVIVGTAGEGAGVERAAGAGTGPDLPGIRSLASKSCCEFPDQDKGGEEGVSEVD